MTACTTSVPDGFDSTDPDLNEKAIPHDEFLAAARDRAGHLGRAGAGRLRRHVARSRAPATGRSASTPTSPAVSKNSKDFSTPRTARSSGSPEGMLREQVELQRVMLINQDPPEHTTTRQIISRGFTPALDRRARGHHDAARATRSCRTPCARGTGNFVEEVAAELPLQAIADLIGVPQEDRRKLFDWSNQMLAVRRPGVSTATPTSPPPRSSATR